MTELTKLNQLYRDGPFAGRIDPWAEAARYFRPMHSGMINALLEILQVPLLERGYVAGRETSLQIAAGREPDVYVRTAQPAKSQATRWDYTLAASAVLADSGVMVDDLDDLDALVVRDVQTGDLVTVLEIISPGNKTREHLMADYRERRARLLLERGVNVVEVDATRSIKRLTDNSETTRYAYHVAIFLPGEPVRIVGIPFGEPLRRIALPLRADVVPVEAHQAYVRAYQAPLSAWHILHETDYSLAALPFKTTLDEAQQQAAQQAVQAWRDALSTAQGD